MSAVPASVGAMSGHSGVLPLQQTTDPKVFGTKAATLARLRAGGERVPDGFVISTETSRDLEDPALASRIAESLATLGADRVAVRSSAIAEDLEDASHAGRYRSVLGVTADSTAVLEAAREVVDSARGAPIAVLVQAMIDAVSAGVAFSANPVSGDAEIVVSAVSGLADRLLEGSVTGDEWVVRSSGAVHLAGSASDEMMVLEVAELAQRLEAHLGCPVDIEWAWDGSLHLLQCRPITALPVPPEIDIPDGSWVKDVTHYPGPLSPLVASLVKNDEEAVARWAERSGLLIERLQQRSFGGELYVRPVPLGGGEATDTAPPWWLTAVASRLHPVFRARMTAAARLVASEHFNDAAGVWERIWKPEIERAVAALRSVDITGLDDERLLDHLEQLFAFARRATDIHFDLFLPYMVSIHELVRGCERLLGWDIDATMRLLSGGSAASSRPTVALREVAAAIGRSAAAKAALDTTDGELLDRLSEADSNIARLLSEWIDRYGFRTIDYDWASPTIAERRGLIAKMLRAELHCETRLLDPKAAETAARAAVAPDRITEFDRLLGWARANYPVREDNVHLTSLVPGALLRRACLEIGSRLAARDLIPGTDDVFFLEFDELTTALRSGGESLSSRIRRRRAERAWVAGHPGPAQYGAPGGPPPDLRGLPAAGRRINEALLWSMDAEFTPRSTVGDESAIVRGLPGAAGSYSGTARIVLSETDFGRVEPGDVVVCAITNPAWAVLFGIAGAFVCDAGGPLSHTAVLTREYDIPSVLAAGDATLRIEDGSTVRVDGAAGTVAPI